jgi:predicted nucleic acid-binding protein
VTYGVDTSFLVAAELGEHTHHAAVRSMIARLISRGDRLALAPQVLAEFIHAATDSKRFRAPLEMSHAHSLASRWWTAREVEKVYPTAAATQQFLDWMVIHRLGRKRLLDTMLAATYLHAGIYSLVTLDTRDFNIFGCFQIFHPASPLP